MIKLQSTQRSLTANPIGDFINSIAGKVANSKVHSGKENYTLAVEAYGTDEKDSRTTQLANIYNNMETTIKDAISNSSSTLFNTLNVAGETFGAEDKGTINARQEAGTIAGILATDPARWLGQKLHDNTEGCHVVQFSGEGYTERPLSMEAYDERENKNAQTYSIVFNILAARQNEFGEALFPTIVVNPNEVGVQIETKLLYVVNDFKRSVTGALAKPMRRNIIRAYVNAEILHNEQTKAIPVLRDTGADDDNSAIFVPTALVPPHEVDVGNGIVIKTAPLATGKSFDLLGASQTDELISSGIMGNSDALDSYIKLEYVYIKFKAGNDDVVVKVSTTNNPFSTFVWNPQGNTRKMSLHMDSSGFVLKEDTKLVTPAGKLLKEVVPVFTGNKARYTLGINGHVILDKADCRVNGDRIELDIVRNQFDEIVTGGNYNAIKTFLATGEIIGYDVTAYRANSNLRQRGQLFDLQTERQIINIPYRSPFGFITPPVGQTNELDQNALQTLITATGMRVSNEAVTALLRAETVLAEYVNVPDAENKPTESDFIARNLVNTVYREEVIELGDNVDSLTAHDRLKDIRATLVEKIRLHVNEMWRDSEYPAAALVYTGNQAYKPTVVVATDPVLYNYIQSDGEIRTLGETFDLKVVSTLDSRIRGKIYITFGVFDDTRNNKLNPLNFGYMLWSPEVVTTMNISRNGQTSKELTVSPRFQHGVCLPILTTLTVTGLPEVIGKVPVYSHVV